MIIWFIEMINKTDGYDILIFFIKLLIQSMAMKYHWQIIMVARAKLSLFA